MKRLTLLIAMCFMIAAFTNAQIVAKRTTKLTKGKAISAKTLETTTPVKLRRCGSAEAYAMQIATDPEFKAQREATEKQCEEWIAAHPEAAEAKTSYTIPIVVHVIYNTTTEAISLAQVQSQITATNADWAGLNTHSMGAFATSLKAATGVQFCLATVDPNGNATTGVDYVKTTVSAGFNITGSSINCTGYPERCTSTGGAAAWDVTKYFNVWVCPMSASSGLCGISVFPTASNSVYYGSTINYLYFGTTGTATAPYNLGGTLSHEIGHCFNLYHTWGDDNGACTGTDNCADTPNSGNMNYGNIEAGTLAEQSSGVSTLHTTTSPKYETDNCTSASPGVLFQDFMDYSDDIDYACFTPNQVSRIQAIAAGDDLSLSTSGKCGAPAAPVAAFTASATAVSVGATVTFTDQSTNAPTSWLWTLTPSTGFTYAGGTSSASQDPKITFTTAGTYTVALKATNATGNNTCTKTGYIVVSTPSSAPVAAFTANNTSVLTGATVTFTDQSTNSPATWAWTLTPSTGFTWAASTTAASQDPQITFTAAGTYTVALKASNSVGNNTCTKTNYITVTAGTTTCDTLAPPTAGTACGDSLVFYNAGNNQGYLTGNDQYGDQAAAQVYKNTTSAKISTVLVGEIAVKSPTPTATTVVNIYSINATTNAPTTLLGTSNTVALSAISTTSLTAYTFTTPVTVTGAFAVSVAFPTTAGDTLAVFSNPIDCYTSDSLSWELQSTGTWYSYAGSYGQNSWGDNLELAIYPVLCSTAVSIKDITTLNKNVTVYPNPSKDVFTIDFSDYGNTNATIEVYTIMGKLIKTISSNGLTDKMSIDLSDQSTGVYILNIKTPEGSVIKKLSLIK